MKNKILIIIFLLAAVLRFYKLDVNPPGLYWDEAAFGYDAYSVLKTGRDQYGVNFPLFFKSFGDWKLPVYFYLLVPSVAIFGLSEFAVRFPSAFLGTSTILIFFLLVKKLTRNENLALFTAFFLAISPWHIQFSRGGFESTAGLFFLTLGVYIFLLAKNKKSQNLYFLSLASIVISMYTYHAYRIFSPLLTIVLFSLYFSEIKKSQKEFLVSAFLAFLLAIPIFLFTFSEHGRSRAISQSAFSPQEAETRRIDFDQNSKPPFRFLSGRIYPHSLDYLLVAQEGYLDHFSPIFLFFSGDKIGRHSQVDMGQIYLFEGLLFIFAAIYFRKLNFETKVLMLAWLLLAPFPATIVKPTPHAYRTLQMALALSFFSGLGAYWLFYKKGFVGAKILISAIIIFSIATYLHLVFVHYPKKFAADWQDGYREMVQKVKKHQDNFEKVYVTDINQVPYIYLLFYQKYDPQRYQDEPGTRNAFGKYHFVSRDENLYDKGRIMYVAPNWQKVDGIWLDAVNDSSGHHIYSLWEIDEKK